MEKIFQALLGICLIIFGMIIIRQPKFYSARFYYIDFTGYNVPLGIFIITVGLCFIWLLFKRGKRDSDIG